MKQNELMETSIESWLEAKTGASRRQMAMRIAQPSSSFNRNIGTPEVIIAVCRAYNINPVEGLIYAGHLEQQEVNQAAASNKLTAVSETELLEEVLRRVKEREPSELTEPIDLNAHRDPDYTDMSENEAFELGLVAKKQDDHIGDDEQPNES